MKVLKYTYNIPFYGNRHDCPYGKITFIGVKGKPRTLYYELGTIKNNYEVINTGSLYYPHLEVKYYG